MNALVNTVCAATLTTTPVLAGVSPESFVSSLQNVMLLEAADVQTAKGEIRSIAEDKASFVVKTDDGAMTVRVSDATVYTLNGKASKRDDALKIGRDATVTHEDGLASRVDIISGE